MLVYTRPVIEKPATAELWPTSAQEIWKSRVVAASRQLACTFRGRDGKNDIEAAHDAIV